MVESLLFIGAGAGVGVGAGEKKIPRAGQKRTGSKTLLTQVLRSRSRSKGTAPAPAPTPPIENRAKLVHYFNLN